MKPSVKEAISALSKNNIEVEYFQTGEQARKAIISRIPEEAVIGLGGSTTVNQIGLLDALQSGQYHLIDQYEKGISPEESLERRRRGILADLYITGTNAITQKGQLVNCDGMGNRVAAQIFGPKKTFIVTSVDKIVPDLDAAFDRIRKVAAPMNAKRLGINSACARGLRCEECEPETCLCNFWTVIDRQREKGKMTVFLIEEKFGF